MLRAIVLVSCIMISASAYAQSREDLDLEDFTVLVEGHVFNLRTHTPIQGALVRATTRPVAPSATTDANGFYSLEVDLEIHDSVNAQCRFQLQRGPEVTYASSSSLPALFVPTPRRDFYPSSSLSVLSVPSLRRDFYLDVRRVAEPIHCLPAIVPGG